MSIMTIYDGKHVNQVSLHLRIVLKNVINLSLQHQYILLASYDLKKKACAEQLTDAKIDFVLLFPPVENV